MPTPIPPTLSPIVEPSNAGSLTLITSVLDATSTWLLLRYLYAALRPGRQDGLSGNTADKKNEGLSVILVSFLRPFELWREMGRKVGLDLPSLLSPTSTGAPPRLTYIDAFTHLSFSPSSPTPPLPPPSQSRIHTLPPFTTIPGLESQLLSLLPKSTPSPSPSPNNTNTSPASNQPQTHLLLLDAPDLLLATTTDTSITPFTLTPLLLSLRSQPSIHSTILTLSADSPLLHTIDHDRTPLELSHRQFLTLVAHQSNRVVQLRGLETGAARDVGGVLRLSRGGAGFDEAGDQESDGDTGVAGAGPGQEGEWLYQVKADGSVSMWARGE